MDWMQVTRLRFYVGLPMTIAVLSQSSDIWFLARVSASSERVPQWALPLQMCTATGQGSLSGLPVELAVLAIAGFAYWIVAFRGQLVQGWSSVASRPVILIAASLFWALILATLLWESFGYILKVGSVSSVAENVCREWMISKGSAPASATEAPATIQPDQ